MSTINFFTQSSVPKFQVNGGSAVILKGDITIEPVEKVGLFIKEFGRIEVTVGVEDILQIEGVNQTGSLVQKAKFLGDVFAAVAGSGGGGGGGTTTDASALTSGTLPDARLSGSIAKNLVPTAIKTASYTAAANDFVRTDATSASVPITLPTAPADKTRVAVKMIAVGGSFNTTVATGGSDVLNKAGGSTSITLSLLNQAATFQYESSTGIWSVLSSDIPLSQLDTRFTATTVPIWATYDSAVNNLFSARPFYQKIIETRIRRQNANWQYSGSVRTVGSGKTYATISAAIAAATTEDIIQVDAGTYLTSAETGGVLTINTTKRLLIVGMGATPADTIIQQNAVASYCVRLLSTNNLTFRNLTITSDQTANQPVIVENGTNAQSYCFDNCVITNTNAAFSLQTVRFQIPAFAGQHEFKNTTIHNVGTAAKPFSWGGNISDANKTSFPNPILMTGCTFDAFSWADNNIEWYCYNSTVTATWAAPYIMGWGVDTGTIVRTLSKVDIRECTFKCLDGISLSGHGILIGQGTNDVYFVNNSVYVPPSVNAGHIGIAIKSLATVLGNVVVDGNYVEAPEPFTIKTAQNCYVRYNTAKCNWVRDDLTDGYAFRIVNSLASNGSNGSTGNVITFNNFEGHIRIFQFTTTAGAMPVAASAAANTINNNIYKVNAGTGYIISDATTVTFANKATFWTNDVNSIFITP